MNTCITVINEGMFGNSYDVVEVNTLKNIMEKNNHKNIDILN